MRIEDFEGRSITLLGVGIETLDVLGPLRAANVRHITVVEGGAIDDDRRRTLRDAGVNDADIVTTVPDEGDVVLRSPGYPRNRADVVALGHRSALMTTPTGLWLALRGPHRTVVVTGTKGKSSTATLIHDGLVDAGVPTQLIGNIGRSPWGIDPMTTDVIIAELSSYQGADLISSGEVAVLTMLRADHLDWHGSLGAYQRDKLRILGLAAGIVDDRSAGGPFAVDAAPSPTLLALDDEPLPARLATLVNRVENTGDHRHRNAALAAAAVNAELNALGKPAADITALTTAFVRNYPHLAGRFAEVATVNGVRYIDDALASNPTATAAGLEALRPGPTVLICGGHDRSVSLAPVLDELSQWPEQSVVIAWLGDDDDHRRVALAELPAVSYSVSVPSMNDAVIVASLAATRGGSVLFSPLAPTEPAEGTWKDRSAAFHDSVAHLDSPT